MLIQPRLYQVETINKLKLAIKNGKRKLVTVAPTGSGKTVIASAIIEGAVKKNSSILFLAHRRELIEQCSHKLDQIGIDHGILMAKHERTDPSKKVQVASVQTLIRRDKPKADLIFIDEAHRCLADSYVEILDDYPGAVVIGLTATPWRTDGRGLGRIYDDIIVSSSVKELTRQGYLVIPKVYAPSAPDLKGIRIVRGDYDQRQLSERFDNIKLIGDLVENWSRLAKGRRTVIFGASIAHSKHITKAFQNAGIKAEHVDGEMSVKNRDAVLQRLRSGETTVLSNCDIVTEGYDLPVLSCAVLARPTKSSVKYLQMVGRIMRPEDTKKDAVVLDHSGCTLEHGFVQDDRIYSLDDREKHSKENQSTVKICNKCFSAISINARKCPECGAVQIEEAVKREIPGIKNGKLVAIDPNARYECKSCGSRNTKLIRSIKLGSFKYGLKCNSCDVFTIVTDRYRAGNATIAQKSEEYKRLKDLCASKGYKTGWTSHKYKEIFGVWPAGRVR